MESSLPPRFVFGYRNSVHRASYTREFLGMYSDSSVAQTETARRDPRTRTILAAGALQNWPTRADEEFLAKERKYARLMAKTSATPLDGS